MNRNQIVLGLLVALLADVAVAAADARRASDWPSFRGPGGDGLALQAKLPLVWSETTNVAWKVPVTGRGRSSPVVLGDRLWLTTALERGVVRKYIGPDDMQTAEHVSLRAVCLDQKTGKTLWEVTPFDVPNPDPVHWLNEKVDRRCGSGGRDS